MPLSKPFFRITRPFTDGEYIQGMSNEDDYILSPDYTSDRTVLVRAYTLIVKDLFQLFGYIEPSDANLTTYSHKTYELLLRASTEFETNCKRILDANGYVKSGNLNISDYHKIESACRLSEYKVILDTWDPRTKVFEPLKEWAAGHSLGWYSSYNEVKHDRSAKFAKASLNNVMGAVTGLLTILFSQFYVYAFNPYRPIRGYTEEDDGSISVDDSPFSVIGPRSWSSAEQYDFNWKILKASSNPIDKFSF